MLADCNKNNLGLKCITKNTVMINLFKVSVDIILKLVIQFTVQSN